MQNIVTRELAKVWCGMTPEQRSLTLIPEENYDVVKAFSEGAKIEVLSPEYTMQFSGPRQMYKIVQPKWEPKGGQFVVNIFGEVNTVGNQTTKQYGVQFETKEAAGKAAKYYRFIHRLYKLAEELNEGWEPDLSINEGKYAIFHDHRNEMYSVSLHYMCNFFVPVFKDEQTADKAIKILNNEDKYWESI